MQQIKRIILLILTVIGLISCVGKSVNSSTNSASLATANLITGDLLIGDPGVVPIVNNYSTKFYVYITNTSNQKFENINWSLSKTNSGFKIVDTNAASSLSAGQSSKILIEAEAANSANAVQLIATFADKTTKSIALASAHYNIPNSVSSKNILKVYDQGVFNTSAGISSRSVYIINQSTSLIDLNNPIFDNTLPDNLKYEIGQCPTLLASGDICQVNLKITSIPTSGDKGDIANIVITPSGKVFNSGGKLDPQQGSGLTIDSRLVGNLIILPSTGFVIDALNNSVEPGTGYIINNGVKAITVKEIKTDNSLISVTNDCSSELAPGQVCSYTLNTSVGLIKNSGNTLVTIHYFDSKNDLQTDIVGVWKYIAPKSEITPHLQFLDNTIILNDGNNSEIFNVVNTGNVELSELSLPQVHIDGAKGSFTIEPQDCPIILFPGEQCSYKISYTKIPDPELLSGLIGNITATYLNSTGTQEHYAMRDHIALNAVFNEKQALFLNTDLIQHSSNWSQNLTSSSKVVITNISSGVLTGIKYSSDQSWITASGCPTSLEKGQSCDLNVTTVANKPNLNDTSGEGVLTIAYELGGRVASQGLNVSYHVIAKPVVTPLISVAPSSEIQVNLVTDSSYQVDFSLANHSTVTNGGNSHIRIKKEHLIPKAENGITFAVNLEPGCKEVGDDIILNSQEVCNYKLTLHTSGNLGLTNIPHSISYNYEEYSDSSTEPSFTGHSTYEQAFDIQVNPRRAQLSIINMNDNNFANMLVRHSYSNTYLITNEGNREVSGDISFSNGNLPGNLTSDFADCQNLPVHQSCKLTLVYSPLTTIVDQDINVASINYNDGVNLVNLNLAKEAINANKVEDPNIVVDTTLNGCGIGNGFYESSVCKLNAGSQSNKFSLVMTLTNKGGIFASNFYFTPKDFSNSWVLYENNCGTNSAPITLAKDASCSITYKMKDGGDSAAEYSLDPLPTMGEVDYGIGISNLTAKMNIVLNFPLYIDVEDPILSVSFSNESFARLESNSSVDVVINNWFQTDNPSADIVIYAESVANSGFKFVSGNVCTWNLSQENGSGVCKKEFKTEAPVVVSKNAYTLQVSSIWNDAKPTLAKIALPTKAPIFTMVSNGAGHICGLTANHKVYCWGGNQNGQLGIGSIESKKFPTLVIGNHDFININLDYYSTCALTVNHEVYCWGSNGNGELGDGSTQDKYEPTRVSSNLKFSSIVAKGRHACAIALDSKDTYCWGSNKFGQVGINNTVLSILKPEPIDQSKSGQFKSLSLGNEFSCGIATSGDSYCWGYGGSGQLGHGEGVFNDGYVESPIMVNQKISGPFKEISSGLRSSCGIAISGYSYCWGLNNYGELGIENYSIVLWYPEAKILTPSSSFKLISSGWVFNCGISDNDKSYCWGSNEYGQLGNDSRVSSLTPVEVSGSAKYKFTSISSGMYSACAISADNITYCWGDNSFNLLGVNREDKTYITAPEPVN